MSSVVWTPAFAADSPKDIERLSIDECVRRALANSRILAAERHRLEALEARVNQAFWKIFSEFHMSFLTSVVPQKCAETVTLEGTDANGNPGSYDVQIGVDCEGGASAREEDYSTREWGPTLRFKVKGGVPIYTFGKILNGKKALAYAEQAKQAEYPRFRLGIEYKVQQAYQAISGAREMLYTVEKGREQLKKAREKVESDLENEEGTSTQIDLIKLQVFENEVEQYEHQSKEIERTALAALRFLVGGDVDYAIDTVDEPQKLSAIEIRDLGYYKNKALEKRPELNALKYAVKALEAKVRLRKAEFAPDLLLVGEFGIGWTPRNDDINNWTLKDSYNYGPGFGIGISLEYQFDIGLDIHKLKEAKAELAALTLDKETALDGIMLEVSKSHSHAIAVRDSLRSLDRSKRLVKGWIAAVMQNHATGLGTTKDVKDALVEYFKIMAGIHKLTHDYNVSVAELRKVSGDLSQNE